MKAHGLLWLSLSSSLKCYLLKASEKGINSSWEKKGIPFGCTDHLKKLFSLCACGSHWFYMLRVSEAETCSHFMWLGDRSQENPVRGEQSQQDPQISLIKGGESTLNYMWSDISKNNSSQEPVPWFFSVPARDFNLQPRNKWMDEQMNPIWKAISQLYQW